MKSNRIGKLPLFPQVRRVEAAYSKISLPFFPTFLAQFVFHFQLSLYSVIFLKNGQFSYLVSEKILGLKKNKKKKMYFDLKMSVTRTGKFQLVLKIWWKTDICVSIQNNINPWLNVL